MPLRPLPAQLVHRGVHAPKAGAGAADAGGHGIGATVGRSGEPPASGAMADGFDDIEIVEPLCAVFRRALKGDGKKYTPERAAILDAIIRIDGLFEAEQLLEMVKAEGFRVAKATIYRTLKLLEESGIVQKVLFDKDQSHYQLVYGTRASVVLVRVDTGEVHVLDAPELVMLRDRICAERGLRPEGHRLQIFAVGP